MRPQVDINAGLAGSDFGLRAYLGLKFWSDLGSWKWADVDVGSRVRSSYRIQTDTYMNVLAPRSPVGVRQLPGPQQLALIKLSCIFDRTCHLPKWILL